MYVFGLKPFPLSFLAGIVHSAVQSTGISAQAFGTAFSKLSGRGHALAFLAQGQHVLHGCVVDNEMPGQSVGRCE